MRLSPASTSAIYHILNYGTYSFAVDGKRICGRGEICLRSLNVSSHVQPVPRIRTSMFVSTRRSELISSMVAEYT